MASAQDLRKRIKSVTNTQQITKAMKMVVLLVFVGLKQKLMQRGHTQKKNGANLASYLH